MNEPPRDEQSIFLAALGHDAGQAREEYLQRACGSDTAMLGRVRQLLRANEEAAGPSDTQSSGAGEVLTIDPPQREQLGMQIGPFVLREKIGEGGMGVVFVAEQKEPVKRRVALKIIKPGMDSQEVIARFEQERQALALMDHPNIAKVLDAGTTESGRPYFVMELVNGLPITAYCDEQRLSTRERLELFVPICQAVQHAHQKGVIHRDLKPSNILVASYDGVPVPKVIDFGVAKATGQTLTDNSIYTQFGQMIGTLEYMSPEQAERNQLDIDTRSDIYSLGVVLYELLTGDTPFDRRRLRSAAFAELLRIIREEEPPRPSTRLSTSESLPSVAANRRMEPQKISRAVRGELDWIVMKCLEKDRTRRYDTASAFAEDIDRFLDDREVLAQPPTSLYRAKKFARRHRAMLTSITAVVLALAVGVVGISWQLVRVKHAQQVALHERNAAASEKERALRAESLAQDNLHKARSAVNQLSEISARLSDVPGAEPLRRDLLESALKYYTEFIVTNEAETSLQEDLAAAHLNIGRLKFELGATKDALASYASALDVLDHTSQDGPEETGPARTRAETCFHTAYAECELGHIEQAIAHYETAIQLRSALLQQHAAASDQSFLARDYHNLAIAVRDKDGPRSAVEIAKRALELARDLVDREPDNYDYRTRFARVTGFLGALKAEDGQWEEARSYMELTAKMHAQLVAERPEDMSCQRRCAVSAAWLARSDARNGDFEQALQNSRRAVEIGERLVADFPRTVRYRVELAEHYLTQAAVYDSLEKSDEAEATYQAAIGAAKIVSQETASFTPLLRALDSYGTRCLQKEDYRKAADAFRELLRASIEANLPDTERGRTQSLLGIAQAKRGLELLESDETAGRQNLEQAAAHLENAYAVIGASNEGQPPRRVTSRLLENALELLVKIHTACQRPQDAAKWQLELDKRQAARAEAE